MDASIFRVFRFLSSCLLFVTLQTVSGVSTAAVIKSSATQTDVNRWTYAYDVTAEVGESEIQEFSIFFDYSRFSDIRVATAPSRWDVIVIQPDAELMSDGYIDALALAGGIAPGTSVAGFFVSFTFLGNGPIGQQAFDIIDPSTFRVLSSGRTQLQGMVTEVPEPSSATLLGLAFAAWLTLRTILKRRNPPGLFRSA